MSANEPATQSYQYLRDELDHIMAELSREDIDIDEALEYYQRGTELVKLLEAYLKTAENKIQLLQGKTTPKKS